jgi:hypothetical protein
MLKALCVFHMNPRSSWMVMETPREPERFINCVGARLSHGIMIRGHGLSNFRLRDGLAVVRTLGGVGVEVLTARRYGR